MEVSNILAMIDAEISNLQQARKLLAGSTAAELPKITRGRPKGSKNTAAAPVAATKGKRKLTPEGRKAIADAMKRRWAERKKVPAKKTAAV